VAMCGRGLRPWQCVARRVAHDVATAAVI
jgi:hypothetical protein